MENRQAVIENMNLFLDEEEDLGILIIWHYIDCEYIQNVTTISGSWIGDTLERTLKACMEIGAINPIISAQNTIVVNANISDDGAIMGFSSVDGKHTIYTVELP